MQVEFKMIVFVPMTHTSQALVCYIIFGLIILFNLAGILLIQYGYQVKLGDIVIFGEPKLRRVIVTLFGYEVSVGDYDEADVLNNKKAKHQMKQTEIST